LEALLKTLAPLIFASFGITQTSLVLLSLIAKIGRVVASRKIGTSRAVFNCACKLRWLTPFLLLHILFLLNQIQACPSEALNRVLYFYTPAHSGRRQGLLLLLRHNLTRKVCKPDCLFVALKK